MNKNEKIYQKYKAKFFFIFEDKYLKEAMDNHFDQNGSFVVSLIALLQNKIEPNKILNHLKINKDEWSELFCQFYNDENIIQLYKKLELNPIIPLEQIIESFSCFEKFINLFLTFLKNHQIYLNIEESQLKNLIKSIYGYLFYNKIECKIPYQISEILCDKDYDTKYQIVVNNTKLFGMAKAQITQHFQDKINNLIVLLLGMNKSLNKDK